MHKFTLAPLFSAVLLSLAVATPASAAVTTFSTILGSAGEPVPTSTATGAALVSFDDVANSVTVLLSFAGLANNAPFGHIHCCTASPGTGSAPVFLNFTPLPAATTGSYVSVFSLSAPSFATLLAGASAGLAYVNIHTPGTYSGGEIRGFLPAVPEPATTALMLGGLGVLGFVARRRKQA